MATLDFETRSDADLTKTGPWPYARHSTTEVLCLAYRLDNASRTEIWFPWMPPPQDLFDAIERGEIMNAHNAFFEKCIWYFIMVLQFGWPEIPEQQWSCTAARAAVLTLPRNLAGAARKLNLPVQKDADGAAVMKRMMKPRKVTKTEQKRGSVVQCNLRRGVYETVPLDGRLIYNDGPNDYEANGRYCIRDVDTEHEMGGRIPQLSQRERIVWLLDQRINARGIRVDRETCRAAIAISQEMNARLNAECSARTGGYLKSTRQVQELKYYIEYWSGYQLPKLDKEMLAWVISQPDIDDNLKALCRIRQEQGKVSTAKYQALLDGADPADDRIRDVLLYAGASTGRWASRRAQLHNLPRDGFDQQLIEQVLGIVRSENIDHLRLLVGEPMRTLSWCLRNCLIAAPGKKLVVCDLANIESRGLAWLAGEDWKLDAFRKYDRIIPGQFDKKGKPLREGPDIYMLNAQKVQELLGIEVSRQVGKVCELALGYGGGLGAFRVMGASYNVYLPDEAVEDIRDAWRAANPAIVKFWWNLDRAAKNAILNPGKAYEVNGKIWFWRQGQFLMCQLPSGRRLYYCRPRIEMRWKWEKWRETIVYEGINSQTHQWGPIDTYGGKLAENVTQALCRDFLVEGMINWENHRYEIVLHVHDEAVAEVDQSFGSATEAEQLMTAMPPWADGCPIAAEGFESPRYRK